VKGKKLSQRINNFLKGFLLKKKKEVLQRNIGA